MKATIYAPSTRNGRKRYCKNPTPPKLRVLVKKLQNKETREQFTTTLNENLQGIRTENCDTATRAKQLIDSLTKTAAETLPVMRKNANMKRNFTNDEHLNELLEMRSGQVRGTDTYKLSTKKIKKHVKYIKNQRLRQEAEQINQHATRRETEELFRTMKDVSSSFKPIKRNNKCSPEKLKEYFSEHFNIAPPDKIPDELLKAPPYIKELQSLPCNLNHAPPTIQEVKDTLKSLKNGKASTDIPPEFLKYSIDSETMLSETHYLICNIWDKCNVPTSWTHTKLVALSKGTSKGSITDPKSYRGLQVGTILCKVLVIIILNRIKSWYDQTLLDQQQGFRSGRGTADGIFITKRVQQISDAMKRSVYVLFVDLSAAFDHVIRDWLFKSIYQRLPPNEDKTLFKILEAVYSHTTTALSETPLDVFELSTGVRQGGPESPPLYNLFMDYVMRVYEHECSKENIQFVKFKYRIRTTACTREERMADYYGDHLVDWSGYADDIELFLDTPADLQNALTLLHSVFNKFGLHINIKKTKSMILNFKYVAENHNSVYPKSIVTLEKQPIENVETFRYLGDEIKFNEPSTGDAEVDLRINIAEAKFYQIIKKLVNYKIYLKTRVLILNSLVRSRLTYSCQTWNLTQIQMQKINSAYLSMLRILVRNGCKREEFHYIMTNKKILELCNTEDIHTFVSKQQKSYLEHLARQPNKCLTKRLLFNDNTRTKVGRSAETLEEKVIKNCNMTKDQFYKLALKRKRDGRPPGSDRLLSLQ